MMSAAATGNAVPNAAAAAAMAEPNSPTAAADVTWEPKIASIIQQKVKQLHKLQQNQQQRTATFSSSKKRPFMVALVGIPGSGKSTSAKILSSLLEQQQIQVPDSHSNSQSPLLNTIMPMDGYHYPIATLQTFPNAADCIYRRGAPDTFDVQKLKRDLKRITSSYDETKVSIPGFDHEKGDPEEPNDEDDTSNAHTFHRNIHEVVICEGLYLLHQKDGWDNIQSDFFDLSIYIHSDINAAVERLKVRNTCIPGYTVQEIQIRCELVDRVNANLVEESKVFADIIVESAAA